MAVDFAKISVQLEAESAQLRKELDKANQKLSSFERGAKKSLDGFSRAAKAALGVFTVGAVVAATRNALNYADSIDKASQSAGVGAEFLQRFRFAAEQSGVSMTGADDSLRRFNRRLGEFINSGGGPAAKAMEDLNIAVRDVEGNVRPTEAVFADVVKALEGVETSAQRGALAAQLFGDDFGPKLVPLLEQGIDGINRLGDAANVLTQDQIDDAVRAKDAINQLSQQFTVAANSLVLQLAPALEGLADFLSTSLPNASNLGARSIAALRQAALEVGAAVSGMSADISEGLSKVTFGEVSKRHEQFAREYRTREVELRQAISREIQVQIEALDDLERKNQRFTLPDTGSGFTPLPSPSGSSSTSSATSSTSADTLREANQEAAKLQSTLDRLFPDQAAAREFSDELQRLQDANLPADQLAEAVRRLQQEFADATGGPRKLAEESEEAFEQLSVFAEQAARNTQDALAEFLYDPFDDGLEGMVSGFADAMQRMAAEAAAAQIFDAAGEFFGSGGGSAIGSFFSDFIPGFANGTSFAPGGLSLVGERGPELVNLPRGSEVIPNNKLPGGGTTNVITVNVTGEQAERNRQSGGQLARDIARNLERGARRNG